MGLFAVNERTEDKRTRPYGAIVKKLLFVGRSVSLDLLLVNAALYGALHLAQAPGQNSTTPEAYALSALPVSLLAAVLVAWRRLYRIAPRYVGFYDFLNISFIGLVLALGLRLVASAASAVPDVLQTWAAPVLFGFTSAMLLAGVRIWPRIARLRQVLPTPRLFGSPSGRALIVGAGDAGEMVLREIAKLESCDWEVVGFVDDNGGKTGMTINGVTVLGKIADIPRIVKGHDVEEVLIAMPSATGMDMRRVFAACSGTKARIRTLPSFSALMSGSPKLLPMLRELRVDDLLRRHSVTGDMSEVAGYVSGERVLITGGGGSIGSELARQVAALSPASLILLGKGENSIFEIDQELRHRGLFQSTPTICDVRDKQTLEAAFQSHCPSVVFHAAAHKHVPLMEGSPIEAIRNNVFGTLNVIERSVRHGVRRFILVSTDKAVDPKNVMGATKRVAEMMVNSIAAQSDTDFAIVRFGNVLGSRGSLVPILEQQIRRGGPLTITHPDMTRFFMTIPEAAQLILKAGAIGEHGEIFILDMGEAIQIVDLAKDMIRMHGLVPGQDIEIKFTGVRPGEKIHEQLFSEKEKVVPCRLDKVYMAENNKPLDWDWLRGEVEELRRVCDSGNADHARRALMELAWGRNVPPISAASAIVEAPLETESRVPTDRKP